MSGIMQYEFHLFGPRKGQTININGHQFVNGVARLAYSSEAMGSCIKVLSMYGAYARGTSEYNAAMEREERANGIDKIPQTGAKWPDVEVRRGVRPVGERPTPQEATDGGTADDPNGGSGVPSDVSADGDGLEHAGIPKFPEDVDKRAGEPSSEVDDAVKAAILKLDPDVDEHWVRTGPRSGKPKLQSVEEAYGKTGLDIKDLENALPGWTRDAARKEAAEMFGG